MKAKFDMYAENVHCQRIYFAGCHDSGYTSMLTSQTNQRDKIILLRHMEYHHHFKDLGFDVEDINVRNQRLNPSLSPPNRAQLARWNGIYGNWGLCKEFHLVGCCRYERCKFKHGSASEDTRYLLDYTSRSTPCHGGRGCRYVKCVRGHVCQKRECVSNGGTQFRKLPKEAHGNISGS